MIAGVITGTTSGGNDLAAFGYDGAGNITSVSGDLFGAWTLGYDDESRLTSVTYPDGEGTQTDGYEYNALGQRKRHHFSGGYRRYVYAGERVLEVTNDAGDDVRARYTLSEASYFAPMLHMWFPTDKSRFPLYDGAGTVRRQVDNAGAVTDSYSLEAFGQYLGGWGSSSRKYQYGGAWAYLNDPSGLQQLGATRSAALRAWVLLAGARPVHPTGPHRGWGELVCLCSKQSGGVGGSGGGCGGKRCTDAGLGSRHVVLASVTMRRS